MVLLEGTTAFSPLEILGGVGTAGNCLHARKLVDARSFYFIIRMPVYQPRCTFHQHKGLVLFQPAHHCVMKPIFCHGFIQAFIIIVVLWIAVPGDHIQKRCHFSVIKTIVKHHKICCHRDIRGNLFEYLNFRIHKIIHIPGSKSFPLQVQPHNTAFTICKWRLNLIKIIVTMTPEGCPPCLI